MKTKLLLLLLWPLSGFAQGGAYQIRGQIAQHTGHQVIYLMHSFGDKNIADSCVISNGSFQFSGKVNSPDLARLTLSAPRAHQRFVFAMPAQLMLYLQPGLIKVTSADSLQHATVSGNQLSEDYQALRNALMPYDDGLNALQNQYYALGDAARQKEFYQKQMPRLIKLNQSKNVAMKQFIVTHPRSVVSLNVLQTLAGPVAAIAKTDSLFQLLSAEVQNTPAGKKMATYFQNSRRTEIGQQAPDFTQNDTSGKAVPLHNFRGKYLLIDFWASWCVPCRAENPNVVKAYNTFKSKGFTVLSVSLDSESTHQAWNNAIKKDGLDWTNVSDLKFFNNEVAQLYGIRAIPQNFLLDPDGKIIARNLRGDDLDKKLTEIFSAK